jgi:PhoH-like ATPase
MIKHIAVVEGFENWNQWYQEGRVELTSLNHEGSFHPNQGVVLKGGGAKDHGLVKDGCVVRIAKYFPSGVSPKNTEQTIALGLLNDPGVPLTILSGVAGSGKTMLACAHALERLDRRNDNITKIVIAKSMTPVGREIGYLPGDMQEKVLPWLGPFSDNFINCGYEPYRIEKMIEDGVLEITPVTFIQGRSITNAVILIDEVQNLDINVIKQIVTRAAAGTQIILLGDQTQVFERLGGRSIDYLLQKSKSSPLVGSIHLEKTLRSPIADWAVKNL